MRRIQFWYKNHHNKTELRTIEVLSLDFVPMPHPDYGYGPGWFLHGKDFTVRDGIERQGEPRSFALSNIVMRDYYAPPQGTIGSAFRLDLKGESIIEFLAWASTQPEVLEIGASKEVPLAIEALKRFENRFAAPKGVTTPDGQGNKLSGMTEG